MHRFLVLSLLAASVGLTGSASAAADKGVQVVADEAHQRLIGAPPFAFATSADNGATWSAAHFPVFPQPIGRYVSQPINSIVRGPDGAIYMPTDSTGKDSDGNGSISVVFNGELFDYPEQRAKLEARGHRFRTHCDTELFPHMWEEYGDRMFDHLHGQYAVALYDRNNRRVILARSTSRTQRHGG